MEYLPECAKKPAANVLAFFGAACIASILACMAFYCVMHALVCPARFSPVYGCFYGLVRPVLAWRAMEFLRPVCGSWFSVFRQKFPCALCRQNCRIRPFMALHVYIYVYRRFALPMAFLWAYGVR